MPTAPSHDEQQRLAALHRYEILDTPPEPAFDRITAIAARVLGMPIALITLIDSERQWFKSSVGTERGETPREAAFCSHTILQAGPLVVPDARRDRRFSDNPYVTGEPRVRFYAGAPLATPDGFNLGSLCVVDHVPRELGEAELATLRDLAALVVDELELRSAVRAKFMAQTALDVAQAQLRERLLLLRGIVESAGEGILVLDRDGRIVLLNPAGMKMMGMRERPLDVTAWRDIGVTYDADGVTPLTAAASPMLRALRGENTDRLEVCIALRARPKPACFSVTGRPMRDDAGAITGAVVTFKDISELREARERVLELAQTDELTSLPNRRAFRELLGRLVAEAQRGRSFALVLLDIDHFKRINDSHGHQRGDEVLQAVARKLTQLVERSDFVARYGGEEFCILYLDVDQARALQLAEALRANIAALTEPLSITASFGVCASEHAPRANEETLIARADAALYRAKQTGRNCVRAADADGPSPRTTSGARS